MRDDVKEENSIFHATAFVPDEFDSGLRFYTRVVVVIATLTLVTHAIKILKNSQPFRAPIPAAIRVCVSAIFYIMIAFFMFSLAAVPLLNSIF